MQHPPPPPPHPQHAREQVLPRLRAEPPSPPSPAATMRKVRRHNTARWCVSVVCVSAAHSVPFSCSACADSDEEIGLTASTTQRATITPITEDAATAKPATAAKSNKTKPANAATGQKRKAAAAEEDDESSADEADPNELIDVEFGIYDPRPIDYLTLKALLKDYVPVHAANTEAAAGKKKKKAAAAAAAAAAEEEMDDAPAASASSSPDFALHELCDTLVSQVGVGSMVKGEGTEEPLGFLSAVNLAWQASKGRHSDSGEALKWPAQFKSYILKHTPSQFRATFESALSSKDLGLLIQSRLLNVPPQIVPQLHQCLLDDLTWTRENGVPPTPAAATAAAASAPSAAETAAYRSSFVFKTLLLVGRTFKPPAGSARQAKIDVVPAFVSPFASKKKQKKAAAGEAASSAAAASASLPEFEWIRFEEELYAKYATAQFTFAAPYSQEDAAAGRLPQNVVVMLIPASKHAQIVQELHAMAAMV